MAQVNPLNTLTQVQRLLVITNVNCICILQSLLEKGQLYLQTLFSLEFSTSFPLLPPLSKLFSPSYSLLQSLLDILHKHFFHANAKLNIIGDILTSFEHCMSKTTPSNGISNYNGSQEIIVERVVTNVFKLEPLSFTYATILCVSWNLASKGFTIFAKITFAMLGVSKRPTLTCLGTHASSMKFTTKEKMSNPL